MQLGLAQAPSHENAARLAAGTLEQVREEDLVTAHRVTPLGDLVVDVPVVVHVQLGLRNPPPDLGPDLEENVQPAARQRPRARSVERAHRGSLPLEEATPFVVVQPDSIANDPELARD